MVSLGPPTGWTPAATPGAAAEAAAPAPGQTPAASEWRSEGSVLLGLDLVRSVFDATGAPTAQVKAMGAPEGALDEKKQAVKELCREEVTRLEALRPPKKAKVASSTDSEQPVAATSEPASAPAVGSPPSMVSLLPASAGAP